MLSMNQNGLNANRVEGIEDDLPIDSGGLHDGGCHFMLVQPIGALRQSARQRAEGVGDLLRLLIGPGQTYRGGNLHLMNIKSGRIGMDNVHRISLYHVCHNISSLKRG